MMYDLTLVQFRSCTQMILGAKITKVSVFQVLGISDVKDSRHVLWSNSYFCSVLYLFYYDLILFHKDSVYLQN